MRRSMRRPPVLSLTSVLALALAVAACDKAGAQTAAPAPAANKPAPVQWDFSSKDPAKNPDVANRESKIPGYNP
jgi:hypothetical protein